MTKTPYIKSSNLGALVSAIREGEGKATARTMDTDELFDLIRQAEDHPAIAILPTKERHGIRVTLQKAHKLPTGKDYPSYYSTVAVAEWGPKGWRLVDVYRDRITNTLGDRVDVWLPADVADEARRRFNGTFTDEADQISVERRVRRDGPHAR